MIFVITGDIKCGKTTLVKQLVEKLGEVRLWGFMTPSIFKDGRVVGYMAEILPTHRRFPLVAIDGEGEKVGRFTVLSEGKKTLYAEMEKVSGDFFIFDEFGPLELRGGGLRGLFEKFLQTGKSGIVVIRRRILDDFLKIVGQPYRIIEAEDISAEAILNEISKFL